MSDLIEHLYQSLGERIRTGPVLPIQRHGKCRFPFKIRSGLVTAFLHGQMIRPADIDT